MRERWREWQIQYKNDRGGETCGAFVYSSAHKFAVHSVLSIRWFASIVWNSEPQANMGLTTLDVPRICVCVCTYVYGERSTTSKTAAPPVKNPSLTTKRNKIWTWPSKQREECVQRECEAEIQSQHEKWISHNLQSLSEVQYTSH